MPRLAYSIPLGAWRVEATARASYVGESRLSFDPGLDRESEAVTLLSAQLSAERGPWRLRFGIDNLTNTRADTFAFGNPFTIAATAAAYPGPSAHDFRLGASELVDFFGDLLG